ncbi:MAG: hypothetical protein AAF585_27265 [Verrucomicrobiota bacterium]
MSLRKLWIGFSVLSFIGGFLAAILAPGGWLSDWKPSSVKISGFEGQMNELNMLLGFERGTPVPMIGLILGVAGAIGLIFIWATKREHRTD